MFVFTSGQEGGVGSTLCLLAQPKEGQQFKNKKQPELPENRTVQKSDNQELKKKHSSIPVGGAEMVSRGGEDSRQGGVCEQGGLTFACR